MSQVWRVIWQYVSFKCQNKLMSASVPRRVDRRINVLFNCKHSISYKRHKMHIIQLPRLILQYILYWKCRKVKTKIPILMENKLHKLWVPVVILFVISQQEKNYFFISLIC